MKIPITQSSAWGKLQEDLGERSFFEQGKDYLFLAILKKTPTGNYLYLPYGPVASNPTSFRAALRALTRLAKQHQAFFIRIEPQDLTFAKYLPPRTRKVKDLNPKDTWVLDLTTDKDTIISNFSQGTRTRYNTFAKKGLTVARSQNPADIHQLVTLQHKLAKSKHINTFSESYLRSELEQPFATLYLVRFTAKHYQGNASDLPADGQVLAASLFFDYQGTRYYMQSAADYHFKKLPATVALLSTAIFDAKSQGLKTFDFWGIAPDDAPADHPWRGFTDFKKSFGGQAVHYAGTYDIVLRPMRYRLYQALRSLNRRLRRR